MSANSPSSERLVMFSCSAMIKFQKINAKIVFLSIGKSKYLLSL